jgi:hypothetical protein
MTNEINVSIQRHDNELLTNSGANLNSCALNEQ